MKKIGNLFGLITSLCFILVVSAINIYYTATKLYDRKTTNEILQNVDYSELTIADLEGFINIAGYAEETKVTTVLANELQAKGIEAPLANALFETNETKELLGDILSQVIKYEIEGATKPKIYKSQLAKYINLDSIVAITGKTYTDDETNSVTNQINDLLSNIGKKSGGGI